MGTFAQLLGISGVGKSTRVTQLLMFLMDKYKWEKLKSKFEVYNKKQEKNRIYTDCPYGIYFSELNIVIFGKWVKSRTHNLFSWVSLDYVQTKFGLENIKTLLLKHNKSHVIVEGYVGSHCVIYKIPSIFEIGFDKILSQYFFYPDDIKFLQERIVGRSGKQIKSTWHGNRRMKQNKSMKQRYNNQQKMISEKQINNVLMQHFNHNTPITRFGASFLKFIGMGNLVSEFLDFSKQHSALRNINNIEENYKNISKYIF